MPDSVGSAYLTLVPKLKSGWSAGVKSELGAGIDSTSAGKKAGTGFASAFTPAMKAGIVAGAVAVGAAVAEVTKQAVEEYAKYEQLVGGTELMFGEASDQVKKYAQEAFSTVQMSANDYLGTANFYATGLKEALGGDQAAAAELSNSIITAQADIVAATGASAESVSNAFQGVMKGNYSMLDNLQLGIKPTKEGMQEVIDKMNEWNAEQGKSTNYQMDNYADMEKALTDYVAYVGMAGYASAEASGTIEGSVASAKSAWSNWLVGLATDGADVEQLTTDLIDSISNVIKNLAPVVGRVLLAIVKAIPPAIQQILVAAVTGIAKVTYQVCLKVMDLGAKAKEALLKKVGEFKQAGIDLVKGIVEGIGNGKDWVVSKVKEVCSNALDALKSFFGIHSPSRVMAQMGGYMMQGLANGIDAGEQTVVSSIDGVSKTMLTSFAGGGASASYSSYGSTSGITINNLTVNADDVLTADNFVAMMRRASAQYA